MSFFKGSHNHHEITAYVHTDGSVTYTTEAIPDDDKSYRSAKEFTSLSAIEAAIDKYELSLRKKFTNTVAYMLINPHYRSEAAVEAVTVTSLTPNGKEAWIKNSKDERRKVRVEELFNDLTVCQAYLKALSEATAAFRTHSEELKDILNRHAWKPEAK